MKKDISLLILLLCCKQLISSTNQYQQHIRSISSSQKIPTPTLDHSKNVSNQPIVDAIPLYIAIPITALRENHTCKNSNTSKKQPIMPNCQKECNKQSIVNKLDILLENNYKNIDINELLLYASEIGYTNVVKIALKHKANTNYLDRNGNTALILAAKNSHEDIVELLIHTDCDINITNNYGETALIAGAKNRNRIIIELLLDKGAIFKRKTSPIARWTKTIQNPEQNDPVIEQWKNELTSNQHVQLSSNVRSLFNNVYNHTKTQDVIDFIRTHKDLNLDMCFDIMNIAIEAGNTKVLKEILTLPQNVDNNLITSSLLFKRSNQDISPLCLAAKHGQIEAMKMLLQKHKTLIEDPQNFESIKELTEEMLHIAVIHNQENMISFVMHHFNKYVTLSEYLQEVIIPQNITNNAAMKIRNIVSEQSMQKSNTIYFDTEYNRATTPQISPSVSPYTTKLFFQDYKTKNSNDKE